MARQAPVLDDDDIAVPAAPSRQFQRRLDRRAKNRQRDLIAVGVLTPALLLGIALGVLVLGQTFAPDTYIEPTVVATATPPPITERPTAVPVAEPIDIARLNAGIVDKPPAFAWPEIDGYKVQPDPGRPNEHADYVPALSDVNLRRMLSALSVNLILHSNPTFALGAVDELAKPYPGRPRKEKVLDLTARAGYVPDDSVYGVVYAFGAYRVQIEAVPTSPPIQASQRAAIEYEALHLADHLTRRLQEAASGGTRTGPEATAVHWRDHIARVLPVGR